ncbi:MAG: hypothetical protein FNNCIFGK_01666 [Bacteroidia bacterium]|nr:hypothetical protein [Bacteroidia bacterium]
MNCKHRKVLPLLVPINREAGVTNFYETFVLYSTLVFQINRSAETPRLQQYPKRYRQPYQIDKSVNLKNRNK